ncbi:Crp/Fnr family transcriptional regulator [Flavobacterium sp.]|uniref:Crp/Fnr family transcriptional regulator n=1 Tax=Flavobacterium sp. TaxID=239 RepID=UPI00374D833D
MHEQIEKYIRKEIHVSDDEVDIILSFFKPLTPKRNEILVTHGQTSQRTYFVGTGCLRIFFINEDGADSTRYLAFEDNFATALVSFITEEPSFEFIQALEETELLYITRKDFYHLTEIIPAWEKFYRHYLEMAYVTNTKRLMSFVTMDARERYKLLLSQNPNFVQRLPNKMVASYLNISQETLSRLKSRI